LALLHECKKVQGRVDRQVVSLRRTTPKVERQAKRVAAGKTAGKEAQDGCPSPYSRAATDGICGSSLRYLTFELQRLLSIVVLTDKAFLQVRKGKRN